MHKCVSEMLLHNSCSSNIAFRTFSKHDNSTEVVKMARNVRLKSQRSQLSTLPARRVERITTRRVTSSICCIREKKQTNPRHKQQSGKQLFASSSVSLSQLLWHHNQQLIVCASTIGRNALSNCCSIQSTAVILLPP